MRDTDVLAESVENDSAEAQLKSDLKAILQTPEGIRVTMWLLADMGIGAGAVSPDPGMLALYNFALSRIEILKDIAPLQVAGILSYLYGIEAGRQP